MEGELDQLKSVFRSLVVSSPTQVDARSLLRDYRNMVGTQIPLAKFGYRDPIAFLRERFSDCFIFQGPSGNPELTLIVPDTLKHVDKFVQKQKVSSTAKYKGKRRSVPQSIVRPGPNLIASTFVSKQNLSNKELSCTYKSENTKENHATPSQPQVQNGSQVFQKKEKNIQNGESSLQPQGDTKRRTASLYMAYERQQSRPSNDRDLVKEDDHSGRLTSLSNILFIYLLGSPTDYTLKLA
ncbi:jg27507 [Pararge aegeria aegeria]|uniref:Jg27507 protein n=1 Tax=Pararge aegeria aegeria TaxID=348720 RepID=A0A8S4SEZ0_9NEOP|nr:jg27507 [Pararge aegeria aegeria]